MPCAKKNEAFRTASGVTVLNANPNSIWYNGNTTDSIESCNPVNFFVGSELQPWSYQVTKQCFKLQWYFKKSFQLKVTMHLYSKL